MAKSENFISFFTGLGFFVGLTFSIINFSQPEDILFYTLEITLVFYLLIHIAVMGFLDIKPHGKEIFDKQAHEAIGEYFTQELEDKEKVIDYLLKSFEQINQNTETRMKGSTHHHESYDKQSA